MRREAGVKLEDFANAAKAYGLPWTSGRVGDFESGRAASTLSTLLVVVMALSHTTGHEVRLADLFVGNGQVQLTDKRVIPLSDLRAVLSGKAATTTVTVTPRGTVEATGIELPRWARDVEDVTVHNVVLDFSETDARMCKNVGVGPRIGAAAMAKLWGRTFRAERNELAGPDANAQRRGQISRRLKADLKKVISDGND